VSGRGTARSGQGPSEGRVVPEPRSRLDAALLARGLVASRSRARDLILRGEVLVDGEVATRPGAAVTPAHRISVGAQVAARVSRGAEKLIAGLDAFGIDPKGLVALDVGASTGGFTQVLVERGAARVYAVDVGRGQLAPVLRADRRVVALEGTDARRLDRELIPEAVGLITADVSFISLTLALPAALGLGAEGCRLVALVKPQFEAGREAVGKGGIVRDDADRLRAVARVESWLGGLPGWRVAGRVDSGLGGKDGNREVLVAAVREEPRSTAS
jgi:23S rRNA (cytidine1920-2'-O)/16S rRNA (cytidine1409-2'-O)-methyltransferase